MGALFGAPGNQPKKGGANDASVGPTQWKAIKHGKSLGSGCQGIVESDREYCRG